MAQASRTISRVEEQMSANVIFETWTQTWGIKVYPAYGIDKLKFSFIEKGAQGKGRSFDIYMECLKDGAACFDNWAYDILHGRMERILNAEKQAGEKYAKAYKYTTGENKEKSIGIMNSTNGEFCINASVPGEDNKKVYCNVPISFHDLRHIAEWYQISYKSRKDELEAIRVKAVNEQNNWRKEQAPAGRQPEDTPATESAKDVAAQAKKTDNVAQFSANAKYKVKAEAPITDSKDGWKTLKVLDASGRERTVAFGPKAIEKAGKRYMEFTNHLNTRPKCEFTITAQDKGEYLQFVAF